VPLDRQPGSHRFDIRALPLADRHYSRRKIGSPQFVKPGSNIVLLTEAADALWVTSWPDGQYVRHAWPGAWECSFFRNEGDVLSSELITEAVAITRWQLRHATGRGHHHVYQPQEGAPQARPRPLLSPGRLEADRRDAGRAHRARPRA